MIDSLAPGGAERSLAEMVPHLVGLGAEIHVLLLHERDGFGSDVRDAGASVTVADGNGRPAWVSAATRVARSVRPDIVNTTLFDADVVGRVAARLARVPCVSTLVNTPYGPEHRSEGGPLAVKIHAAQMADRITARLACRFRAVSEAVKLAYVDRLGIHANLVEVIPEGRDPARLGRRDPERRHAARLSLGVTDENLVVLAVGRQEPQKGFDVLLRAAPRLAELVPSVSVFIAGRPGRSSAELSSLIDRLVLGDTVHMLGHREDVAALMCAADVLVLPSKREGIPGVIQEAMALETPIVASDIGPVREALGSADLAELVRPDDPLALAGAVAHTLAHPAEARRRVELARERFLEAFDISIVADRVVHFYETALAGRPHGSAR